MEQGLTFMYYPSRSANLSHIKKRMDILVRDVYDEFDSFSRLMICENR